MSENRIAQLQHDNVVSDLIPENPSPPYDLIVKWPDATLDTLGKELDREATQPEPTLHLHPAPKETHDNYVLIMTDPDLFATNDSYFGQVRHWLVVNVSNDADGKLTIPKDGTLSPYIGPAPLPNYIAPRPHRYVFILSRPAGSGNVTISPEDLVALQQDYSMAVEGPQEAQDLKDRWGFNAKKLLEQKQLEVDAVNYMLVGGTLKSAVDNLAMTAQAGVNKVIGK